MKTSKFSPDEILSWMADSFHVKIRAGKLIWKNPPKVHPRLKGTEAGHSRPGRHGKIYVVIKRDRRAFKRGWLIFLWKYKCWPKPQLDHRDGNSQNDRIGNLRDATKTQNAWNHKGRRKTSLLPMGVRVVPSSGRFQARIGFNGKQIHLGAFDSPAEAQAVYSSKRRELFGEYA